MTDSMEKSHAELNAIAGLENIKEMVAAHECDYDRLEELREERQTWIDAKWEDDEDGAPADGASIWAAEFPSEAEELKDLEAAAGECKDQDEARQRIDEDPLSIQVRGGWHDVGADDDGPEEYEILLATGGPALRIIGELNDNQPTSARLQYQDWGTPWTELIVTGDDHDTLMKYVQCFYFGD